MLRIRVATGRASVAVVTALAMVFTPAAAPAKAPTATTAPARGATAAPVDGGWPRAYTTASGGHVLVYQPQVASWADQRHAVTYAAVAYEAKGASKPALGSLKVEADTKVAVSERLVNFSVLQVTESNFPTLKKEEVREVVAEIVEAIPDEERVIALDRVLASLDRSQILPKNAEGVKADPPKIFFSQSPAVLVNLDGEPIWSPIRENDLKFAVNTNWDLFQHGPTKTFYLRNEKAWLKAADIAGPWGPAGKLPESFGKLPADENWKDVKAALPGQKLAADKAPRVFVSTTPAEMILVNGKPLYKPVPGTKLTWVSNTESDVFRVGGTGQSTTSCRGAGSRRPGSTGPGPSPPPACPPTSRRSRSSTRARVSSPRFPARSKRPRPCCSPRCRRRRASTGRS